MTLLGPILLYLGICTVFYGLMLRQASKQSEELEALQLELWVNDRITGDNDLPRAA
ncbi:MAG: hypothetical protein MUC92_06660 [Fimbriimonadaceae bacterium]|jgi:preprotein translocase subunit YajC|nr:hypothetical protein [Fimbriimonadaceae bacterium]